MFGEKAVIQIVWKCGFHKNVELHPKHQISGKTIKAECDIEENSTFLLAGFHGRAIASAIYPDMSFPFVTYKSILSQRKPAFFERKLWSDVLHLRRQNKQQAFAGKHVAN